MNIKEWWESEGVNVISIFGLVSGIITLALGIDGIIPPDRIKWFLLANGSLQMVSSWLGKQLGNAISASPTNSTSKEL